MLNIILACHMSFCYSKVATMYLVDYFCPHLALFFFDCTTKYQLIGNTPMCLLVIYHEKLNMRMIKNTIRKDKNE